MITLLILINLVRVNPVIESPILNERAEARAEQLCKDKQWSHLGWQESFEAWAMSHSSVLGLPEHNSSAMPIREFTEDE